MKPFFLGLLLAFFYLMAVENYEIIIDREESRYVPRPVVLTVPEGTEEGDLIVVTIRRPN